MFILLSKPSIMSCLSPTCELSWPHAVFRDFHVPFLFFLHNCFVIMKPPAPRRILSSDPVVHERTKDIKIDSYFLQEKTQKNDTVTAHVPSSDIFAKALCCRNFHRLCPCSIRSRTPHIILETPPTLGSQKRKHSPIW